MMRKIFFALIAIAAIAISGCNKPINEPEPPENKDEERGINPSTGDSTIVFDVVMDDVK